GIRSYASFARRLRIDFLYHADFHDMFEVRGTKRLKRGETKVQVVGPQSVEFSYRGLDGIDRRTRLKFDPAPKLIDRHRATIELELAPSRQVSIFATISCVEEG